MAADSGSELSAAMMLALDFFRDPMVLREWSTRPARSTKLPAGIGELIRVAGARDGDLEALAVNYQAGASELGESARFFLQQVLLAPGADHYRVLGVGRDADDSVIRSRHRLLMRVLHPDRHVGQEACWTDAYAARVNQAYNVLRHPQSRARYDSEQPEPVVVSAAPAAARAMDEDSVLMRRAMAQEAGRWTASDTITGGQPVDAGSGRNRTMLLAGLALLVLAFVFGWAMRGNQPVVINSGPVGLNAADNSRSLGAVAGAQSPRLRENGIPTPRLAALGLAENEDVHATEAAPRRVEPLLPSQTGAAGQSVGSNAIPRSRRGGEAGIGQHRAALVIPPARMVEVPDPTPVALPEAVGTRKPAEAGAEHLPEDSQERTRRQAVAPVLADDRPASRSTGEHARDALAVRSVTAGNRTDNRAGNPTGGVDRERAESRSHQEERAAEANRARRSPPALEVDQAESRSPLPINEAALMSLLGRLVSSYQRGDLVAFVDLFAGRASTSDEASRSEIEQAYRQLFANSKARSLRISGLNWRLYDEGAQGEGYMVIQIRRAGRGAERYQGRFTVNVTREGQQLRISGLYYDLDRA